MKKVNLLIAIALILISTCLIYLFKNGIGLRYAKLIKPSVYGSDERVATESVILRMFPDFSTRERLIVGISSSVIDKEKWVEQLRFSYTQMFHKEPQIFRDQEEWKVCQGICWWVTDERGSDNLRGSSTLPQDHVNFLTILFFNQVVEPAERCQSQQQLDMTCLAELSIHEAARKIKTKEKYFFLNKYKDNNFFLFIGSI